MRIQSMIKRSRSYLLAGTIFLTGMCCGMSLVIIASAPTPTPTSIVQRIISQTPLHTNTPVPSTATPEPTTIPTQLPTDTVTPLPSPTYTSTSTPTKPRATALPTNTKRPLPATNTPRSKPITTQTPDTTALLTPQSEFTIYEEQIMLALSVFASKREIVSVKIEDGRANGGERVITVSYKTIETDLEARVKELMDIFVVVGATINAHGQDIDSVKLLIADQNNKPLAVSTVSKQDLVSYDKGEITLEELVKRVKVESLAD